MQLRAVMTDGSTLGSQGERKETETMYCKRCGAKLQDGAFFCEKCGEKVDAPAQSGQPINNAAQAAESAAPAGGTPQVQQAPGGEKKKSNKLFIIIPVCVVVVAAVAVCLWLFVFNKGGGSQSETTTAGGETTQATEETTAAPETTVPATTQAPETTAGGAQVAEMEMAATGYTITVTIEAEGGTTTKITQISAIDLTVTDESTITQACEQYAATYAAYSCVDYSYGASGTIFNEVIVIDTTDLTGLQQLYEDQLFAVDPATGLSFDNVVAAYESYGFTLKVD